MDGVFIINKEKGMTSFDVVYKIKKMMNTKKVGHCGTLDPNATGVLVVCVNKACKVVQFLLNEAKTYQATLILGEETDTYDSSGKVTQKMVIPELSTDKIATILMQFKGSSMQQPPIYSALKVNGKKLYEYARESKDVEIKSRPITIHDIKLISFDARSIVFEAHVSKGTYIRTLCKDIAEALGTVGHMDTLVRTQAGSYHLGESVALSELTPTDLRTIESSLAHMPKLVIQDTKAVMDGKPIVSTMSDMCVVYDTDGKALAVYKQTDGTLLKSVRGLW